MSEFFIGEIRIVSFNFVPKGWASCDGQILPINQNQALFALLGTTYGGNGVTVFALPDLRGRMPVHMGNGNGNNYVIGQSGGEVAHTLSNSEMPMHTHTMVATTASAAAGVGPATGVPAVAAHAPYRSGGSTVSMKLNSAGSSQPHYNMQPYLGLIFCIALQGIFPSRP